MTKPTSSALGALRLGLTIGTLDRRLATIEGWAVATGAPYHSNVTLDCFIQRGRARPITQHQR
ncbi:hypothetical protein CF142_14075 [Aeromonas caviae]|nr:hypothetical protein CF142_14075 [Aeromonas caviae]